LSEHNGAEVKTLEIIVLLSDCVGAK
jgi:hypothetical protein